MPCATLKMEAARSCEMSVNANRHDVLDQKTSNVYNVVCMFVISKCYYSFNKTVSTFGDCLHRIGMITIMLASRLPANPRCCAAHRPLSARPACGTGSDLCCHVLVMLEEVILYFNSW